MKRYDSLRFSVTVQLSNLKSMTELDAPIARRAACETLDSRARSTFSSESVDVIVARYTKSYVFIRQLQLIRDVPVETILQYLCYLSTPRKRFASAGFASLGAGTFQLVDFVPDKRGGLIGMPHYDVLSLQCT